MHSQLLLQLCLVAGLACLASAENGNWTVDTCIAVKMKAELNIFPEAKNVNVSLVADIPSGAQASGLCRQKENETNQTERIDLAWSETDKAYNKPLDRFVNFTFMLNTTARNPYYGLYRLDGYYETRYFDKNVTDDKTNKTKLETFKEYVLFTTFELFPLELQTPVNMSFSCLDIGKISMHSELHDTSEPSSSSGSKLQNVTFSASNVILNAFRPANLKPDQFQAALDCSYRPSDVVPIIVGCALAGTVFLVLVAYLVGRRRNRAAGYQSV